MSITSALGTAPASPTARTPGRADGANHEKYLTFCIGDEEYGLPILVVREIIGLIDVTPLPRTPEYVKGVVNLRGKIIPVMELRARFGLPSVPYTPATCIIVVEVASAESGGTFQLGVIVDGVREVLDIDRATIEPPPTLGNAIPLSFIMGLGTAREKVVILLDIRRLEATGDLEQLK